VRLFWTVFRDGLRESLDKRSLLVLLAFGFLLIALCFGISFEVASPTEALDLSVRDLGAFRSWGTGLTRTESRMKADYDASPARPATAEDGFPPEVAASGATAVEIRPTHAWSLDAFITSHSWISHRLATGESRPAPEQAPQYTDGDRVAFLETRFRELGYEKAWARPVERGDSRAFLVAVRADRLEEVQGASRLSIFGAVELPIPSESLAETSVALQVRLVNALVGFIGMLVLVSVCAAFVPDMLQKGTIDLVLARPRGRAALLLAKYFSAVTVAFLALTIVVGGCALGLARGTGSVNAWLLAAPVLATIAFAALHAVSVLVGVMTRSGNVAALVATSAWAAAWVAGEMHHSPALLGDAPGLRQVVDAAYVALPKVSDLAALNVRLIAESQLSPAAYERTFRALVPEVDWPMAAATTAAFPVIFLALAVWRFRRRDF